MASCLSASLINVIRTYVLHSNVKLIPAGVCERAGWNRGHGLWGVFIGPSSPPPARADQDLLLGYWRSQNNNRAAAFDYLSMLVLRQPTKAASSKVPPEAGSPGPPLGNLAVIAAVLIRRQSKPLLSPPHAAALTSRGKRGTS